MRRALPADPPHWLGTLGTPELGGGTGIALLDHDEWEEANPEVYPAGTLHNERHAEADREIRTGKVLVARGPAIERRNMGIEEDVHWYLDPEAPERLWCALGSFYPGWLWVPVPPTDEALTEVLGGMFPKPALREVDFSRHSRGFVGYRDVLTLPNVYDGETVPFNGHDLDRYNLGVQFLEQPFWGGAHTDDPLRDDIQFTGVLSMLASVEGHSQQLLGRVPSMTWRTLHSRSYVSFEIHTQRVVTNRLAYRPAPRSHRAIVEYCNRELGFNLPVDVPLDVMGALTCFPYHPVGGPIEDLVTEPQSIGQLCEALRICAALWEGDLAQTRRLLEFARHPEQRVREEVLRIAHWYNLTFVLYELALHSQDDPDMCAAIERLIDYGCAPDDLNVFEDHIDGEATFVDEAGVEHEGRWPDDEEELEDEGEEEPV